VKTGCVVYTKYALATLSWTEMRASLRVCAHHSNKDHKPYHLTSFPISLGSGQGWELDNTFRLLS
jgi:hypothetical protein